MNDNRKKLSSIDWQHYRPVFRKVVEDLVRSNPWNEYERLYQESTKASEALRKALEKDNATSEAWMAKMNTIEADMEKWRKEAAERLAKVGCNSIQEHSITWAIEELKP